MIDSETLIIFFILGYSLLLSLPAILAGLIKLYVNTQKPKRKKQGLFVENPLEDAVLFTTFSLTMAIISDEFVFASNWTFPLSLLLSASFVCYRIAEHYKDSIKTPRVDGNEKAVV